MICGTRGDPDTVAPFRAWRGSRDLVAQSPKLHERAVAKNDERECEFSLTQRCEGNGRAAVRNVLKISVAARGRSYVMRDESVAKNAARP